MQTKLKLRVLKLHHISNDPVLKSLNIAHLMPMLAMTDIPVDLTITIELTPSTLECGVAEEKVTVPPTYL